MAVAGIVAAKIAWACSGSSSGGDSGNFGHLCFIHSILYNAFALLKLQFATLEDEPSQWAIMELAVWNRKLTDQERCFTNKHVKVA